MPRVPAPHGSRIKETGDLAFAAFALQRGLKVLRAREWRKDAGGACEYHFAFDDAEDRWEQMHVDFANSESAAFDAATRTLKKLCKRNAGDQRP